MGARLSCLARRMGAMGHGCRSCCCPDAVATPRPGPGGYRRVADSPVVIDGGSLVYPVSEGDLDKGRLLIGKIHDGDTVASVLRANCPECRPRWDVPEGPGGHGRSLVVIYTDLEPDDCMAVTQLWQWKSENDELHREPLIIFCADTISKDGGTILEAKQLMLSLMVGLTDDRCKTLTYEGDIGNGRCERTGQVHPQALALAKARAATLASIADHLASYDGSHVDLYIMAPGHGNLGAILRELQNSGRWPLQLKWRVTMYTGSFNMKGMEESDLQALDEIMKCSDDPLVDVGKHPFFGGKDCHEWTDSLTTFAHPKFAKAIYNESPLLAAVLVIFDAEFNQGLIDPHSKSLFKGSAGLSDAEKGRFQKMAELFQPGDARTVQKYAQAVVADAGIFAKVAGYKRSTFTAYAYGGCDSPLCDQLIFLYEWLQKKMPEALRLESGGWEFDRQKGFTTVSPQGGGRFPAVRPVLQRPKDEKTLMEMRRVLLDYLVKHLKAVDCHVERQAGNLMFTVEPSMLSEAEGVVKDLHSQRCSVQKAAEKLVPQWKPVHTLAPDETEKEVLFIYTDLETDDVMAAAQLSQWRLVRNTGKSTPPLIVFQANFETKDGGTLFEKKRLMTALMLGDCTELVLTSEKDTGKTEWIGDKSVHPSNEKVVNARPLTLRKICQRLAAATDTVDFCLLAPCHGNLGAIVDLLKRQNLWPIKASWRVAMYSGSFNMRGMEDSDLEALREIMSCSDGSPLVDMSRFPFFGGANCHPWTVSLATFAMPTFAKQVSRKWPELAAVFKLFNDEFNEGLITPLNTRIFYDGALDDPDVKAKFERIKAEFKSGDSQAVCKYAKAMMEEPACWDKVRDYKKSTFVCFGYGGCETPLCDQLVFLYRWLQHTNQYLNEETVGSWHLDREKGFTTIKTDGSGLYPAVQPTLASPLNEAALLDMRMQLEARLLKHLQSMSWGEKDASDVHTAIRSLSDDYPPNF